MTLEVTGIMGKRLANQTFETAQLTLVVTKTKPSLAKKAQTGIEQPAAEETPPPAGPPAGDTEGAATMPQNVLLEESEVLETTSFGGEGKAQEALSVLDQCAVLAGCINVENENPLHGLTHEARLALSRLIPTRAEP